MKRNPYNQISFPKQKSADIQKVIDDLADFRQGNKLSELKIKDLIREGRK